jgi:hypothetical protein
MNMLLRLIAALACLAFVQATLADTIHAMRNGGFYHHQSGWVFPEKIGEFSLVGIPTDINGTVDVAGYYAREAKGVRTVVSVSVYPPDSAQPETTAASFKATAVSIEISKKPPVHAARLAFKEGKGSRAILYFVDAGPWIVRIRSSVPAADKEIAPAIEKFVRGQRWDSLQTS